MICRLDTEHSIIGEAAVKMSNVATRGFKADNVALKKFPSRIIAMDSGLKERYLNRINVELQQKRNYSHIGNAACDNMAALEKLGLGTYSKKNMYVIDFSGCFNLILSKMTNSSLQELNELLPGSSSNEFNRVLRAQDKLDITKVMSITPNSIKYFANLVRENQSNINSVVYQRIFETLHEIMGYVFIDYQRYLSEEHNVSIILRSYTYFELIITTDADLTEYGEDFITIKYSDYDTVLRVKQQPEEIIVL